MAYRNKNLNKYKLDNKKVIGAKIVTYDNKTFKSKLEFTCYKLLKEANIDFIYEGEKYCLMKDYRLNKITFYHSGPSKKNEWFKEELTKKGDKLKIQTMTYTPDFVIRNGDKIIYIETKGYANDVYPYKRRLFFKLLEDNSPNEFKLYFFEPRIISQVIQTINIIKNILNENKKD